MAAIVKRLIRQIKGDPTSCKSEQRFHGEKGGGEKLMSCNSGQCEGCLTRPMIPNENFDKPARLPEQSPRQDY